MQEQFGLELAKVDGSAVVRASGEIDLATAPLLRETLEGLTGRVIVDLADVTFLDSTGIGVMIGQRNRLTKTDGELVLRAPRDDVRLTLTTVGLTEWLDD